MLAKRYFNTELDDYRRPRRLNSKPACTVKIDNPREVYADWLVNAYAAWRPLQAAAMIVVDFGTVTTFDVVNKAKAIIYGGVIAPGVNLVTRRAA